MYNITFLNLVKRWHSMTNFRRILGKKFNTTTSSYIISTQTTISMGRNHMVLALLYILSYTVDSFLLCIVRTHDHEIESKQTQAVHSLYKQTSAQLISSLSSSQSTTMHLLNAVWCNIFAACIMNILSSRTQHKYLLPFKIIKSRNYR